MPELPEVETVKKVLEKRYLNLTISDVLINYPNILANISANDFKGKIINQKIVSFDRKGKYLIVNLNNSTLLIHLRMEGKFKFEKSLIDKHSHIIFYFSNDKVLIYHDVRKFGRIYYFDKDVDIYHVLPLSKLGLEPMEVTDCNYLYNKLSKINKPIKSALLDQSILAGIGNIYADEICFACKINPLMKAKNISYLKCVEIINNASIILNAAIADGGTTIKSFQSMHGVDGMFQQKLNVYGKENLKCPNCESAIIKTFINKRGTHYCPNCQRESKI